MVRLSFTSTRDTRYTTSIYEKAFLLVTSSYIAHLYYLDLLTFFKQIITAFTNSNEKWQHRFTLLSVITCASTTSKPFLVSI